MLYSSLVATAILFFLSAFLLVVLRRKKRELAHFSEISDIEVYKKECQEKAECALQVLESTLDQEQQIKESIDLLKKQIIKYQDVVGDFKSAADLKKKVKQLGVFANGCQTLKDLTDRITHHTALADQLKFDIEKYGYVLNAVKDEGDISEQISSKKKLLDRLKKEILSVEEVRDLQEYGFYKRKYEFDSSEFYKQKLDKTRSEQKQMIKNKNAATCETEWTVEGSAAKGRRMVNNKIKLLLRAFNGECDASIAKVTFSNVTSMENRLNRSFEQINKMGDVNKVSISRKYLELKLQELFLAHEYRVQKEEEKEEQRRIKQMMKEEAKVEKEIIKVQEEAEREEAAKRDALAKAREELRELEGKHANKLESLVKKLESELQEALDRKAKAIARAQLTKSGHVYILSNIGSFGKNIYKIGLTRRLEPLERVKELGSASVPFLFDVHAMIYSKNAPELESKLHKIFESRRVNIVNARKEFFHVTLEEIREAVTRLFGEVTFFMEAEASEYRQTLAYHAEEGRQDLLMRNEYSHSDAMAST